MPMTEGAARPTIDWRDWVAFLGYALATAVVISVLLASFVLVVSMQAEAPRPAVAEPHKSLPAPPARQQNPAVAPAASAGEAPAALEITAETLRAEQPIAPARPGAPAPAAAAPATDVAPPETPTPADLAPPAQRIEVTSEALRAEQPMGASLQSTAEAATASPATPDPALVAPASTQRLTDSPDQAPGAAR